MHVVDEEVLKCLQSDLRKNKKKAAIAALKAGSQAVNGIGGSAKKTMETPNTQSEAP